MHSGLWCHFTLVCTTISLAHPVSSDVSFCFKLPEESLESRLILPGARCCTPNVHTSLWRDKCCTQVWRRACAHSSATFPRIIFLNCPIFKMCTLYCGVKYDALVVWCYTSAHFSNCSISWIFCHFRKNTGRFDEPLCLSFCLLQQFRYPHLPRSLGQ